MFDKLSKSEIARECELREIPTEGLDKLEMLRRLKAHERKGRKEAGNVETELESGGESEMEGGMSVRDGKAEEYRMRIKLVEAERSSAKERMEAERASAESARKRS